MTDNVKKFLEKVSGDDALQEKLKTVKTQEKMIAFAKELGFELSPEDFQSEKPASGEIDDDELEAVVGGKKCYCAFGGGGTKTDHSGSKRGIDEVCACVDIGAGYGYERDPFNGTLYRRKRCSCVVGGNGISFA